MGDNHAYPEERHEHPVELDSFLIDRHEVTNVQFARFVAATGYVTTAEREPDPALFKGVPKALIQPGSAVFLPPDTSKAERIINNGWSYLPGASWRHPNGPDSDIAGKDRLPVVQVSFDDALAYARWLGRDLPTEAQFEYAARGGLKLGRFAWAGNELAPNGKHKANTWQGIFPLHDSGNDGFGGPAPVGCFAANGFGLHDMIGNVWEWTQDGYVPGHSAATARNPQGPDEKSSYDPHQPGVPVRVIKGGSYLCADNFCQRYRPAARHAQETGLGTNHIGFRTVVNLIPSAHIGLSVTSNHQIAPTHRSGDADEL